MQAYRFKFQGSLTRVSQISDLESLALLQVEPDSLHVLSEVEELPQFKSESCRW